MLPRRARLLGHLVSAATGPVAEQTPRKRAQVRRGRSPGGGRSLLRTWLEGAPAADVVTRDLVVPGIGDDIPVRLYAPTTLPNAVARAPLVVHFPPGGWVYGGVGASAWLCGHVASRVGAVVAEVGYRLAPEHPFPAAQQDAYAATTWLAEHAERLDADGTRMAVMGAGAGGNLAAAVTLDARDRGRPPVSFQALLYPATDLTLASPSLRLTPVAPLLTAEDLRACRDLYLGPAGDPTNPLVSPLLAPDHSDLPAALVITAEHDPLRDDGRRYAAVLRAGGVPVRLHDVADGVHGLFSFAGILRQQALPALRVLTSELTAALCRGETEESLAGLAEAEELHS